jgi:hypothetical protein
MGVNLLRIAHIFRSPSKGDQEVGLFLRITQIPPHYAYILHIETERAALPLPHLALSASAFAGKAVSACKSAANALSACTFTANPLSADAFAANPLSALYVLCKCFPPLRCVAAPRACPRAPEARPTLLWSNRTCCGQTRFRTHRPCCSNLSIGQTIACMPR